MIVGASVTVDRADVVPSAIVNSGGEIVHFGMPVDPGNLVLLGQQGATRILVLPGCARSPKLNGIDWIFERLAARLPVSRAEIMSMGVGGLLVDSPARPLPRAEAVRGEAPEDIRRNVAAVVLAAGQSRRMGSVNKLLEPVDGEPLIRRTVSSIVNSGAQSVIVVTGHEGDRVKAVSPTATLSDADTDVLKGGRVTVKLVRPAIGESLSLLQTSAIQIAGNSIVQLGVVFGTISTKSTTT